MVARWAVAFAMAFVVVVAFDASPVAAYHSGNVKSVSLHISETVTLPNNTYAGYTFSIGTGDKLTYNIVVTSGSPIDMYIVPGAGLSDYESESAQTFSLYVRAEGRSSVTGAFTGTSGNAGIDTVIVDNVDFSGAVPTGNVTVTVDLTRELPPPPSLALIGGILLVAIIVIAFIAFLVVRARKKRSEMPPPTAPPPYPVLQGYPPPSANTLPSPTAGQVPYPYGVAPTQTIIREREVIREIVRVPCKYCGTMVDSTERTCPSCSGPLR